ncbi:MAG: VanW family protein [Mobilitalea sp.]
MNKYGNYKNRDFVKLKVRYKTGKKNKFYIKRIYPLLRILKLCILIIAILLLNFFVVYIFSNWNDNKTDLTNYGQIQPVKVESVIKEEPLQERIVDGITITDLSKKEAKTKLMSSYSWKMQVEFNGQAIKLNNFLSDIIDALLDDIYINDKYGTFEVDLTNIDGIVKREVATLAIKWDKEAKNAQISQYDKENDKFIYTNEEYGIAINQQKLTKDLVETIKFKNFDAIINAKAMEVAPDITLKQAKQLYKVIGSYTTTATNDSNRNNNIKLASDALNGLIIQPGDEFSFNNTTGNRTETLGYRPAGAYKNGLFVKEPGGGVCQVSSTLYNAVVFSGLNMTERNAHTYEPSYVTPGEDAMVSYDGYSGPDMKFVNQSNTAVAILSTFENQSLIISIFGIPILEEGVTISMESEKVKEMAPPEPTYQEVETLQPGTEEIIKEATNGSQWVTNLVMKKDGIVIGNEYFHLSNYRGIPAIINRNASNITSTPKNENDIDKEVNKLVETD